DPPAEANALAIERRHDPAEELRLPVRVRTSRDAGHPDERDRLTTRDALADRDERRARVIEARLQTTGVLHADAVAADCDPRGRGDDAVVVGGDERPERRGDIDAGVAALEELRDLSRGRPDETSLRALDGLEARGRARVDGRALRRSLARVNGQLCRVHPGARDADEVPPVGAEPPLAEEVGQCRRSATPVVPGAERVVAVAGRNGRRDPPDEQRLAIW